METFFFFFIFIALIVLIYELLAHFQDGNILLYKSKKAINSSINYTINRIQDRSKARGENYRIISSEIYQNIPSEVLSILPEDFIRMYRVFPLRYNKKNNTLVVAMVKLNDSNTINNIIKYTGMNPEVVPIESYDFSNLVKRYFNNNIHVNYIPSTVSEKQELIDINTASQEKIAKLPGINIAIAKKIVTARDDIGGFTSKEEFYDRYKIKPHFQKKLDKIIYFSKKEVHKQDNNDISDNIGSDPIRQNNDRIVDF